MLACELTKKGTCKDKHRTHCNGLVIDCDKFKKPKEEDPKKK